MNLIDSLVPRLLIAIFLIAFSSQLFASPNLDLKNQSSLFIEDNNIWRNVTEAQVNFDHPQQVWQNSANTSPTIVGQAGLYLAKLTIQNSDKKTWFLVPNANFVDIGQAYWQGENEALIKLKNFSQLTTTQTPHLLHFQALPLPLKANENGTLWLYISAKHFPTPVSLAIYDEANFYHYQGINNSVSFVAISIMLLLSLLTFLIYTRTRERIAITCAGYVGLHGLGWAAAAGLIEDFSTFATFNFSYSGMYIFPFAIACASQFVADLFECKTKFIRLHKVLTIVSLACIFLGTVILFLPFKLTFYLSHVLALVWINLTLFVGFYMLKEKDFRAKYFLTGNLLYSASLIYYIASHSKQFGPLDYPELLVILALSVDCICIVLSLSEWFKLKQNEYNQHFYLSRIDPLTKLGNRYALDDTLSALTIPYIVIYIDFDGLKTINDKFGHDEGDKLIKYGAKLIAKAIAPLGHVFRVGGDEFICIVSLKQADKINKLQQTYRDYMLNVNEQLKKSWQGAGLSFGIASNNEGKTPSECLSIADQKMYQHKKAKISLL